MNSRYLFLLISFFLLIIKTDAINLESNPEQNRILKIVPGTNGILGQRIQIDRLPNNRQYSKLELEIIPASKIVTRGERVKFRAQVHGKTSEFIGVTWSGPKSQQGNDWNYIVKTGSLEAGDYKVHAQFYDQGLETRRDATAVLRVNDPKQQKPSRENDSSGNDILGSAIAGLIGELIQMPRENTQPEDHHPPQIKLEISPSYKSVTRGQNAEFYAKITGTNSEFINIKWFGSNNQQGNGRRFVVNTNSLTKGNHVIQAQLYDTKSKFKTQARAVLDIKAPITIPPETPQIKYSAYINADKTKTYTGERITFTGGIEPLKNNVQYQFSFGNGQTSDWLTQPKTNYVYHKSGTYHSHLTVKDMQNNLLGTRVDTREETQDDFIRSYHLPIQVTPEYIVDLKVNPESGEVGDNITFQVKLQPPSKKAKFQFFYGDEHNSVLTNDPEANHAYHQAGNYLAYVQAKIANQEPMSEKIEIHVEKIVPTYSPPEDRHIEQEPKPFVEKENEPLWIWIAALLGFIIIGGSIYVIKKEYEKPHTKKPTKAVVELFPRKGYESQTIINIPKIEGEGIKLKIVKDSGIQSIDMKSAEHNEGVKNEPA